MRGRAYTRHQRARFWRRTWRMMREWGIAPEDMIRLTNSHYKNRRPCSCSGCTCSRRVLGPSVQEQRQPQWHSEAML